MVERLGRYEILEEIGQGGFAVVYRARDTQLDRLVALKKLRPALPHDADWIRRFYREARVVASLDHPHIVTIYDVDEASERIFITMRLVNGPSLEKLIAKQGRFGWSKTAEIIGVIAAGLDYAHSQGILHRDLKPANVLVDLERGPMLSDFGLAKLIGEAGASVTAAGGVVGTAHYIAPEVWEGQGTTRQSDIYALGCILYEMLIGEKLFPGETPPAAMMAHFRGLALPNIWPEGVPPGVANVLATALAKKPSARYATAAEMAEALTSVVKTESVSLQVGPTRPEKETVSPPILTTKLYIPPTRPELVSRPRLIERLNEGLRSGRKLTLVSAPAGFGKTTLFSDWLRHLDVPAAWFSLDEADNDPVRFLIYYVAALQTIDVQQTPASKIGEEVLGMLQSPQPPPTETILTTLLNEIAALPARIVLILDDYHLIDAQPIHDALTFLLEHLPPQIHLVIATREDPPLSLARLRARGQLIELRAADLRFTSAETVEFLNQMMGLNLSAKDIAALETRTEGWVAGLQLAAISMQGHENASNLIKSFTGSHRFVLDYLIEEVLNQQPEDIQTFLLQTAMLDRLTGSLCDAVCSFGTDTGQNNGQQTLEMLEQANLFIVPLDNERHWYRYHHLFADLLLQRLHQTQPEQLPVLYHRASVWYKQNGFVTEAINYALRSENFERAADMIEDQFGDNYERVSQTVLRRWLAEMPEEFVVSRLRLCILHAWNLFSFGQLDAADRRLQTAEKMLDRDIDQELDSSPDKDQLSDTNRMKLVGRVAVIRSFLVSYSGDMPGTIQYASQALEYLPEQELQWRSAALIALGDAYAGQGQMAAAHKARSDALVTGKASGDIYIVTIVNLSLAEVLRQQGKLQQVIDICERQLKRADDSGISESALVGWLFGIWGEVLAELNHLDKAIDQAKKGVKLAARGRDVFHIASSNLYLVRVLFSSGDITGAEDVIQSMENTAREYDLPLRTLLELSAWQVRMWLAQDKLEAASQWVAERELDPDGELTYLHEVEYIVFARILIAQGKLDEATRLLQQLLEAAEAGGRTSRVIEILILQTLAAQSGGDTDQAMSTLEQALTLAKPGGFIRIFVDEGPPMALLLYEALSQGIAPDYVRRLLEVFPGAESEQPPLSKPQVPTSELVEPLSEREIEVLQLIAEGLTNQEIAIKLYLSLNTVKVHTRNIYGKLDAHHRTGAVARARALGILHPN